VWYRNGTQLQNFILTKRNLPVGSISTGSYARDCSPLGPVVSLTPSSSPNAKFDQLAYCEDIAFWELYNKVGDAKPAKRILLSGCDPNRKSWNTVMGPLRDPNPRGSLWAYTVPSSSSEPSPKPQRIALQGYPEGHDFHPLGLEVWPSYAGNASNLYIVNHARARTVIEHFTLTPSTFSSPSSAPKAKYIRTITSPYFVSPNSLALTSPTSFYVSNDHLITRRWPIIGSFVPLLESVFALPLAFISHVSLAPPDAITPIDEERQHVAEHKFAVKFMPFPNGIALSSDKKTLAVASSSLGVVQFYARDASSNALNLKKEETVKLPFAVDNVRFAHAPEGSEEELLVAGHPHFPSVIKVAKNVTNASSGSWVASISSLSSASSASNASDSQDPLGPYAAGGRVKTILQSNGVESEGGFPTSSTALRDPDSGALYIAGLYALGGVLECRPRGI